MQAVFITSKLGDILPLLNPNFCAGVLSTKVVRTLSVTSTTTKTVQRKKKRCQLTNVHGPGTPVAAETLTNVHRYRRTPSMNRK